MCCRDRHDDLGVRGLRGDRAVRHADQARLEPLGMLLGQQVVDERGHVHPSASQLPVQLVAVDPGVVPDRVHVEQHRARSGSHLQRHQLPVARPTQHPAPDPAQHRLDPKGDEHRHGPATQPTEQRPAPSPRTVSQVDGGGGRRCRCAVHRRREPARLVGGQGAEPADRLQPDHRHHPQPVVLCQLGHELCDDPLDARTPVGRHRVGDVHVDHERPGGRVRVGHAEWSSPTGWSSRTGRRARSDGCGGLQRRGLAVPVELDHLDLVPVVPGDLVRRGPCGA